MFRVIVPSELQGYSLIQTCTYGSTNPQTENQPGHEGGAWLEIRRQKVNEPTPKGSDSRWSSDPILRSVEQVLKPACGTGPVDSDDRSGSEILMSRRVRRRRKRGRMPDWYHLKENECSTENKSHKLCTFLDEYACADTANATKSQFDEIQGGRWWWWGI